VRPLTTGRKQSLMNSLLHCASECPGDCCPHAGLPGWRTARQAAEDEWLDQVMADPPRQARPTGPASTRGPSEIELLAALYADPEVHQVLEKHGVPMATPVGPAWKRFPARQPLTAELVSDLYEGCGLDLNHIGLFTGRPSAAVGGVLRAKGIRLRPARETSPFMRRFRQRDQ
jgi:hypothetical protein